MLHGVGRQDANKTITPDSALRYARRVIASGNKEEENAEGQKRKTRTGIIKVSGLSHMKENQCDPRLAWEMFHKICHMYIDIKNKEETNAALLLTSMSDHEDINKVSETTVNSHENNHIVYFYNYERLSHQNSIRYNQEPLKCGTVMKLGCTLTVNGARFCELTITFKGKEHGK